jgi:DNA-binding CsgD family transcriptional regulator
MSLAARPGLTVAGKVAHPEELPALCELGCPDTVILDAGPRLTEFAVIADNLLQQFPGLNVIVIYRDASGADLALACRAGITSLVPESHGLAGVLALLRRKSVLRAHIGQGSLTDRELELVTLASSGHSVAEIASLFGVSPPTVENLKRRVYAKLGVNSSAQAVARIASLGMLGQRDVQQIVEGGELPELTARENDILQSVARGYSIRQTARALGISPKTVENIQTRLFRKLGVRNRVEALAVADALGLLPDATQVAGLDAAGPGGQACPVQAGPGDQLDRLEQE